MTTTPNDHLTIEQRLGRLETAMHLMVEHEATIDQRVNLLLDTVGELRQQVIDLTNDEPDDRKISIGFKDKDKQKDKDND